MSDEKKRAETRDFHPSRRVVSYSREKGGSVFARMRRFFGESERPRFDLIILGMGEDGHTASLFPGSKSLEEKLRFAIPVYLGEPKKNRITLTLPVLNNAEQILFLVAGPSKAPVLSEIFGEGEKKRGFPAGLISPTHGTMTWLVDHEAAAKLRGQ